MQWSGDCANFYSTNGGHKVGDSRQAASVICANQHPGANATQWSRGEAGAWFLVDLKSVAVNPTHFAYRNDYGGGGNHPRTFELQGSNDGVAWTTLSKHTGEVWNGNGAKHWPIAGAGKNFFSKFRILNQGSPNHLCCSGLEIYGAVQVGRVVMPATEHDALLSLGSTPSHGNPASTTALNTELNNVARNTDDTSKARELVAAGADLSSTNGEPWRHTPLHQAAFHGRFEMAKALVQLGARLDLHSNPCGRGQHGTPLELARGGGHHAIAEMLDEAAAGRRLGKSEAGGSAEMIATTTTTTATIAAVGEAVPLGVVVGKPAGNATVVEGQGSGGLSLMEVCALARRELGLEEGTVHATLHNAVAELGIDTSGKTIMQLADEVQQSLGGKRKGWS